MLGGQILRARAADEAIFDAELQSPWEVAGEFGGEGSGSNLQLRGRGWVMPVQPMMVWKGSKRGVSSEAAEVMMSPGGRSRGRSVFW